MTRELMSEVIEKGRALVRCEAEAIAGQPIGMGFLAALQVLQEMDGHLVITGIGKSGIVARLLAATFSSLGTPAIFLDPVNALHGDLGVLRPGDVLMLISKSGETEELLRLVAALPLRLATVALTCCPGSALARVCGHVLELPVDQEAHELAPTSSVVAMIAVGHALAVCLATARGFTEDDFRITHPSGVGAVA